MTATTDVTFTETERARIDALLDVILPASSNGHLPSAATLGVRPFIEARVADMEGFAPIVTRVLAAVGAELEAAGVRALTDLDPAERVALTRRVEAADPGTFLGFVSQVYMGYYTEPATRGRLGMPERPPQPLGHQLPEDDDLDALLAPVRARGKHYLDC